MIYILFGGDTKNKGLYTKELTKNNEVCFISSNLLNKDMILSYALNINLFGESPIIITENILNDDLVMFSQEDLLLLKESKTTFIFKEDKLTAIDQKKYKKYAEIKNFEEKKSFVPEKFNTFSITDAFAKRDKINAWIMYNHGIENGVQPEALAGILFWKIKTMILNGSQAFNKDELKQQSSNIVSIYHRAHRGEVDLSLSLEQFILSALSSK